jgi:hypothetical protein
MLGQGDVDYMDYNISYHTIGSLGQRMGARAVLVRGHPGQDDAARARPTTAAPAVSGKTHTA